jgi:hypothetical protein
MKPGPAAGAAPQTQRDKSSILVASGSGSEQWVLTIGRRGRDWLIAIAGPDGSR